MSHGGGGLPPPSCDTKPPFCVGRLGRGAHSRHVCCVTQHACLLCHTADSLLSHTADMSAVSHSRHVCCAAQQTCLLCHAADMSAVPCSRHSCCVTQQTCARTQDKRQVSKTNGHTAFHTNMKKERALLSHHPGPGRFGKHMNTGGTEET